MGEARAIPIQIATQLKHWRRQSWIWNFIHYFFGLAATLGSVLIAASPAAGQKYFFHLSLTLSVVVALSAAVLTFLKASAKSNAYAQAWRYLDAERICFELDPAYPESKLAEAHKLAEDIIGRVN